ncbi:MAG TPA: UDP-N-acetylmuramate dehydrogenase [Candidatus Dormibacteraeota bacterium]|nr:UDP-N-acetylmuramate dehydrogenase [Candidatus Dormibacteraeota bacterium]
MKIMHDIPLGQYSTMRLGGVASSLVSVSTNEDLVKAVQYAEDNKLEIIMVGAGSNIVWRDEGFRGLVVVNRFPGYEVKTKSDFTYTVRVGSGEPWDTVVKQTVDDGASGLEALSLIPGTTGATPIQNVGAYGQDVSKVIESVEVYDIVNKKFKTLDNKQCGFGYRKSIFNTSEKGKYFILAVIFKLNRSSMKPPFYDSLQQYLTDNQITDFSPKSIRQAVINIRSAILPDPQKVANCGSFFANPIVDEQTLNRILKSYPNLQYWRINNSTYKLAAGWLCEQAQLKGYSDSKTGMSTWRNHALVLVNETAKHTSDLLAFKQKIIKIVQDKYGVTLLQEPELLPIVH